MEDITQLTTDIDEALASVGCTIKDWTKSGQDPSEKVSKDGISVEVGGMIWYPKLDVLEVKIPLLHYGKSFEVESSQVLNSFLVAPWRI